MTNGLVEYARYACNVRSVPPRLGVDMKIYRFLVGLCMVFAFLGPPTAPVSAYEDDLRKLTGSLVEELSRTRNKKIGVMDFTRLDGKVTKLSRFLAEEISVNLAIELSRIDRGFEMVDRQHMKKILTELSLEQTSDLFDPETIKEVGKMSGADAIVTGYIVPFAETVRITTKVINTESGRLFAAAKCYIPKTRTVQRLMEEGLAREDTGRAEAEPVRPPPPKKASLRDLRGLLVHLPGDRAVFDLGRDSGVEEGMTFEVYEEGETIKHPVTGAVLGIIPVPVAVLRVSRIEDKLSFSEVVATYPGQNLEVGQKVRKIEGFDPEAIATARPPEEESVTPQSERLAGKKPGTPAETDAASTPESAAAASREGKAVPAVPPRPPAHLRSAHAENSRVAARPENYSPKPPVRPSRTPEKSAGGKIKVLGSPGNGPGRFAKPFGITYSRRGRIYVADSYNHRIQVFDSSGRFVKSWGSKGRGAGQFVLPLDVAVDSSGHVYVADTKNFRVQKFDSEGRYLLEWGQRGTEDGSFSYLSGLAMGPSGNIYTVDADLNRIQVFNARGRHLYTWGQAPKSFFSSWTSSETDASGGPAFTAPMGVAVDRRGYVFVADSRAGRIQKLSPTGRFIMDISSGLQYPADVEVDPVSGNLYVLDAKGSYFMEFSQDGRLLEKRGAPGRGRGQFSKPYGLSVDENRNLLVADTYNSRMQILYR